MPEPDLRFSTYLKECYWDQPGAKGALLVVAVCLLALWYMAR